MKPKKIKHEDKKQVLEALVRFYNLRPDEYGLMERNQKVYEEYCELVKSILKDTSKTLLDFGTGSWRIVEQFAKIGFQNPDS